MNALGKNTGYRDSFYFFALNFLRIIYISTTNKIFNNMRQKRYILIDIYTCNYENFVSFMINWIQCIGCCKISLQPPQKHPKLYNDYIKNSFQNKSLIFTTQMNGYTQYSCTPRMSAKQWTLFWCFIYECRLLIHLISRHFSSIWYLKNIATN